MPTDAPTEDRDAGPGYTCLARLSPHRCAWPVGHTGPHVCVDCGAAWTPKAPAAAWGWGPNDEIRRSLP